MTNVDITKPIIWTSRGNLNEDCVEKFDEWQFHGGNIIHIVGCKDKATGDVIKRGVYVYATGVSINGEQSGFN